MKRVLLLAAIAFVGCASASSVDSAEQEMRIAPTFGVAKANLPCKATCTAAPGMPAGNENCECGNGRLFYCDPKGECTEV